MHESTEHGATTRRARAVYMTTRTTTYPEDGQQADAGELYLRRIGQRVRDLRARRGMTRKILSAESGVSERYLADLENGRGNISILLLRQVAQAMHIPLQDLARDGDDLPVEIALILQQLQRMDAGELADLQDELMRRLGTDRARNRRIALIGLRGAGKSTLGKALAERLGVPFVQLNREVEAAAGMSLNEIFDLFGQAAYRRLERRCLDQVIETHDAAVIETGGGLVSEPATFERLLSACYTVWLQAAPEEHMERVISQGDERPIAGNAEAMDDLQRILAGRRDLYGKADAVVDTSGRDLQACLDELSTLSQRVLSGPEEEALSL
jgi:XRE family aerobic/anaerobic benzoate catabolism transcriptional regulator